MIGRQVILTKKAFTLEELHGFMQEHWDSELYNDFVIGKPTPASVENYIILPATGMYCVIVYPRKAGLFSRKDKIVLSVAQNLSGAKNLAYRAIPTDNLLLTASQISATVKAEKERKGPAEDVLQGYAEYMRKILSDENLTVGDK